MGIKEAISERSQDALMLGTLMGSILWFMFALQIFSKEVANIVGPVGYFAIIGAGIFGSEIVIREMTNSYPFIDMIVRPGNERYGLFIRPCEEAVERKIGPNKYATTLPLKFQENFLEYGKRGKIILHHIGEWGSRIKFMPGWARWNNIYVGHPQTETIVVTQAPRASTATDHGESIPIFFLEDASKDHYPVSMFHEFSKKPANDEEDAADILSKEELEKLATSDLATKVISLTQQLNQQTKELDEANRQKFEWHQRGISSEEVTDQQRVEIDAVLETKVSFKEAVIQQVLDLIYVVGGIKNAYKAARGKKVLPWLNKWTVALILGVTVSGIVLINGDIRDSIGSALTNPINQLFIIAVLVIVAVAIYYLKGRGELHK